MLSGTLLNTNFLCCCFWFMCVCVFFVVSFLYKEFENLCNNNLFEDGNSMNNLIFLLPIQVLPVSKVFLQCIPTAYKYIERTPVNQCKIKNIGF